jgi:hypothetical protein
MYSKEEASKLRQQFWIAFGKYMKPIPSAEGLPINWVNYKTGLKYVLFKMDVSQKEAIISIQLTHPDQTVRRQYFDQFLALKLLFTAALSEEWEWEQDAVNEHGIPFSKISKTLNQVSIFDQNKWPTLISFLKPRIVALDHFWIDVKPIFEAISN